MRCLIICDEGIEDIVVSDLAIYSFKGSVVAPGCVEFSADNYEPIGELCYSYQGAIKVLVDVVDFKCEKELDSMSVVLDDVGNQFEAGLGEYVYEKVRFGCVRKGDHDFKSVDIANQFSHRVLKGKGRQFKNADLEVFIYVRDEFGFIGIDFSGRLLHKRDYKIFLGSNTLRSTIAYGVLRYAGYSGNGNLRIVDPFMGSGTIPIEAALLVSNTSPFFFSKEKFLFRKMLPNVDWDSMFQKIDAKRDLSGAEIYGYDSLLKFLKYAQKNAKIADVNKVLNLSKVEVDWIDTKLEEDSIDLIVTHPPIFTEHGSKTKILRVYKEMFLRGKDFLSSDGKIVVIVSGLSGDNIKSIASENEYEFVDSRDVYEGAQLLTFMTFKRN